MSALPPKADMCGALGDVRYVPCVDMCHDVLDECQTATKRLQDLSRHPCCEGSVNEALVRRSGWHRAEGSSHGETGCDCCLFPSVDPRKCLTIRL